MVGERGKKRKIEWLFCDAKDSWESADDVAPSAYIQKLRKAELQKVQRSMDKPAAGGSNPPAGKRPRSNTRELGTDRSKSQFVALYVKELTTLHLQRRDPALSHKDRALALVNGIYDYLFIGHKAHVSGGMVAAAWPTGKADVPHFGVSATRQNISCGQGTPVRGFLVSRASAVQRALAQSNPRPHTLPAGAVRPREGLQR